MRHAFRKTAGVDEHQGCPLAQDVGGETVVNLLPHFAGGDGAELVVGNFDGEIHFALMADVDDAGGRYLITARMITAASEVRGYLFDRPHCGGESDALRGLMGDGVEAHERECEVRAALVIRNRMDF